MAFKTFLFICLLASAVAKPSTTPNARTTEDNRVPPDVDDVERIIDGRGAFPGEFPYQVSLQTHLSRHICGGSILSDRWILTAAHCINGQVIIVKAGKTNLAQTEITEQTSYIEQTIIHQYYRGNREVAPYDIALLKLSTPLRFNQYVKPINLPGRNVEPRGMAILSGWGSISTTSTPYKPNVLQTGTMELVDAGTCKGMFKGHPREAASVAYSNICTSPGISSCNGDSGGPLINGNNEVIGIVSWGIIPCNRRNPSVFTKVSSYVDWIREKVSAY